MIIDVPVLEDTLARIAILILMNAQAILVVTEGHVSVLWMGMCVTVLMDTMVLTVNIISMTARTIHVMVVSVWTWLTIINAVVHKEYMEEHAGTLMTPAWASGAAMVEPVCHRITPITYVSVRQDTQVLTVKSILMTVCHTSVRTMPLVWTVLEITPVCVQKGLREPCVISIQTSVVEGLVVMAPLASTL